MSYPKRIDDNRWIVEVKSRDGSDQELFIEIPEGAIDQVGWHEGDDLEWIDQKDGSWMIKKKDSADGE